MPRKKNAHHSAEETEAAFYDAIARADIDALMALWADDEEIVCVHPNAPRLIGHAAIRQSFATIFARGHVQIRPVECHATNSITISVHNIIEEISHLPANQPDIHILSTNVYIKTSKGWRIVAHHASVAPGRTPMVKAAPPSSLLH